MEKTKQTREEALRQQVYKQLYLGALKIQDPKYRLIACYIILLGGRLGLRASEIQHVRSAWIDWERGVIAIPESDPCGCRRCWKSAKQMKKTAEETDDPTSKQKELRDMTIPEIVYEYKWNPKTETSPRQVPFGYSPRLTAVIMEFQSRFACLDLTQQQIRNIVKKAAAHADGVDEDKVTTRGLRGTAATFFATLVYRPKTLQDLLGWARIETARKYLKRASGHIAYLMYQIFGAERLAPPIFPTEPEEDYPLVANPQPYKGEWWDPRKYGYTTRKERAETLADEPLRLYHPREPNPFDEFEYNSGQHEISGAIDLESDLVKYENDEPVIEAKTLDEVLKDHDMQVKEADDRRQDVKAYDWPEAQPPTEQTTFSAEDLGWSDTDDESTAMLAPIPGYDLACRCIDRVDYWALTTCQEKWGCGPLEPFGETRARRFAFAAVFLALLAGYGAYAAISTGLVQPDTMTITPDQQHFQALVLAVAFVIYTQRRNLPDHRSA